jgi:hypothetical protein
VHLLQNFAAEASDLQMCTDNVHFLQIPSTEIDKSTDKFFSYWDPDKKSYIVSFSIHVLPFCLAAFIRAIGFTTFDLFLETDATILQAKTTGG